MQKSLSLFLLVTSLSIVNMVAAPCMAATPAVLLNDLKQMGKLWYIKGETQPFTGTAVTYHENGEKATEIQFRKGLRHGKETGWYPGGKLKHIVRYRQGEPQGLGSSWYPRHASKPEPISFALCSEHPELVSVCGVQDTSEPSRLEFCSETSC